MILKQIDAIFTDPLYRRKGPSPCIVGLQQRETVAFRCAVGSSHQLVCPQGTLK